jgi:hypothetical protein
MKNIFKLLLFISIIGFTISSCNQDKSIPMSQTLNPNARFATNAQDLQAILNEATTTNTVDNIYLMNEVKGNFTSNMKWKHPSRNLEISGGAIDGSLIRTFPKDMSEAVNGSDNFYRYSINVHDILFKGAGNGLSINCMYSPIVYNCQFEFKDTGLIGTFALNALVQQNRFTNCKMVASCFKSGVGTIPGAGLSTSASNNCRFIGNRVFNATGAKTGLSLIACSGINIEDHISEGGIPDYHIFIDGLNNTTSWFRNLERIHIESKAAITSIYIAERQGFVHLADLFFQYPSNMIEVASQAGAITVIWDRIAYIPNGSTIKSTGNTVRWKFNDVYPNINVTNTALWVGNKLPAVLNFNKLDGTGYVAETWVNGVKK